MPRYSNFTTTFWGRKDIMAARILMYYWRRKIREGDDSDRALMKYWARQAFVIDELQNRDPSLTPQPEKAPRGPRKRKPYARKPRHERPHPALRRDAPKKPRIQKAEKVPEVAAWVPLPLTWD